MSTPLVKTWDSAAETDYEYAREMLDGPDGALNLGPGMVPHFLRAMLDIRGMFFAGDCVPEYNAFLVSLESYAQALEGRCE